MQNKHNETFASGHASKEDAEPLAALGRHALATKEKVLIVKGRD